MGDGIDRSMPCPPAPVVQQIGHAATNREIGVQFVSGVSVECSIGST